MKDAEVERTSYMKIDLENQKIIRNNEDQVDFEVDEFKKYCLLNGLDDIGLTLQKSDKIRGFEKEYSDKFSWA
jgi:3-isopropylmalate dehydratase small subunit